MALHTDFPAVAQTALRHALPLLRRWLPDGRLQGHEYVALNPRRADRRPGSFRVNVYTGKWADFSPAAGIGGGDLVSLLAYLAGCSQGEAAATVQQILGE